MAQKPRKAVTRPAEGDVAGVGESLDAGWVNPLSVLIQQQRDQYGWSFEDIARQSGYEVAKSTVATLAQPRRTFREPPSRSTLDGLARGLRLPVELVEEAAVRAAGYRFARLDRSPHERVILAAVQELSAEDQRRVATMVLNMTEALHAARQPPEGV